jgi:YHS domain-containing protein
MSLLSSGSQDTTVEAAASGIYTERVPAVARRVMANPTDTQTVARDPVCGMNVSIATAKHTVQHEGKTYYFCCGGCATKFKADPGKYLSSSPQPASAGFVSLGTAAAKPASAKVKDPVCGMDVDPATAKAKSEYEGKTYYFCSAGCLEKFKKTPETYLAKTSAKHQPAAPKMSAKSAAAPVADYDVPRGAAERPGTVSQVRHGSGAGDSGRSHQDRIHVPHAS